MFKKTLLALIALTLIVMLVGCGGTPVKEPAKEQFLVGTDVVLSKIENEAARGWIEEKSSIEGTHQNAFNGFDVYVVALGEKPTGGYQLDIKENKLVDNEKWLVEISVKTPVPQEMVTQALTYPYLVFAVATGVEVEINFFKESMLKGINLLDDVEIEGDAQYVTLNFVDNGNIVEDVLLIEGTVTTESIRILLEDGHYVHYDQEFSFQLTDGTSSFTVEVPIAEDPWAGFLMLIIMAKVDGNWIEDVYVPIELPEK